MRPADEGPALARALAWARVPGEHDRDPEATAALLLADQVFDSVSIVLQGGHTHISGTGPPRHTARLAIAGALYEFAKRARADEHESAAIEGRAVVAGAVRSAHVALDDLARKIADGRPP